ncbi:MAG: RIP metalloprotease RseP [Gemmatimonadota bacterium]|nr:RIP metalloprotease RseP [Gemmatimonadota bacterium]
MITTILAAVFVLGLLVFVHELGHFLAAKRMGIRVKTFSLGFPPKMIGKKIGDTEYCISWIPLGGYVQMAGEHPDADEVKGEPWEFQSKSLSARAFVIAAGPAMNIILTFVIFWFLFFLLGVASVETTKIGQVKPNSPYAVAGLQIGDEITAVNQNPVTAWGDVLDQLSADNANRYEITYHRDLASRTTDLDFSSLDVPQDRFKGMSFFVDASISTVVPSSPASQIGIQPGDVITEIDGQPISQWTEMVDLIKAKPGMEVALVWTRDGEVHRATVTPAVYSAVNPETGDMEDVGRIGVTKEYYRSKPVGFFESFQLAGVQVADVAGRILVFVNQLVSRDVSTNMVGGPIFIAQLAGETARQGAESLFNFIAFLSLNLAILNLLPIPALDGGQLLILGVEGIIRRPLSLRQRLVWQQVGMVILAFIMVFVIVNDISRVLR